MKRIPIEYGEYGLNGLECENLEGESFLANSSQCAYLQPTNFRGIRTLSRRYNTDGPKPTDNSNGRNYAFLIVREEDLNRIQAEFKIDDDWAEKSASYNRRVDPEVAKDEVCLVICAVEYGYNYNATGNSIYVRRQEFLQNDFVDIRSKLINKSDSGLYYIGLGSRRLDDSGNGPVSFLDDQYFNGVVIKGLAPGELTRYMKEMKSDNVYSEPIYLGSKEDLVVSAFTTGLADVSQDIKFLEDMIDPDYSDALHQSY